MARQKTSILEDFIWIISRLPWWVCIILAIVSYLVLHNIATVPAPPMKLPNDMSRAVTHGLLTTFAMFGQYILPFAFGMGALVSGISSIRNKKVYKSVESRSGLASLNEISWQDFERLVGENYRHEGFHVTREGGNGPDGGVDLVLKRNKETYLVQCKQWRAFKVGSQPVREFYGVITARGASGGYFVTSGVYTEDAQEFARGLNIELIDGIRLRKMMDTARKEPTVIKPINGQSQRTVPVCPRCGAEMKKRIARRGKNAGEEFWGCITYPKCNGILSLKENTVT
jgi:restriction system protein